MPAQALMKRDCALVRCAQTSRFSRTRLYRGIAAAVHAIRGHPSRSIPRMVTIVQCGPAPVSASRRALACASTRRVGAQTPRGRGRASPARDRRPICAGRAAVEQRHRGRVSISRSRCGSEAERGQSARPWPRRAAAPMRRRQVASRAPAPRQLCGRALRRVHGRRGRTAGPAPRAAAKHAGDGRTDVRPARACVPVSAQASAPQAQQAPRADARARTPATAPGQPAEAPLPGSCRLLSAAACVLTPDARPSWREVSTARSAPLNRPASAAHSSRRWPPPDGGRGCARPRADRRRPARQPCRASGGARRETQRAQARHATAR